MNKRKAIPIEDIFSEFDIDEEFKKLQRQRKPFYDLILEIIKRRNQLGITQQELAEKAKTHQSRISKIESAEHDIRLSTLTQIAEALDTQVSIRLVPNNEPIEVSDGEYRSLFKLAIAASHPKPLTYTETETSSTSFKANSQ